MAYPPKIRLLLSVYIDAFTLYCSGERCAPRNKDNRVYLFERANPGGHDATTNVLPLRSLN